MPEGELTDDELIDQIASRLGDRLADQLQRAAEEEPLDLTDLASVLADAVAARLGAAPSTDELADAVVAALPAPDAEELAAAVMDALGATLRDEPGPTAQEVAAWAREAAEANRAVSRRMDELSRSLVQLAAQVSEAPAGLTAAEGTLSAVPHLPARLDELRRSVEALAEQVRDLVRATEAGVEEHTNAERRTRAVLERVQRTLDERGERLDRVPAP